MRDDDGGFDGGPRPAKGGRGKIWLIAALAVIAIAMGVAFAMQNTGGQDTKHETPTSQSPKPTKDDKASEPPSEEPSIPETDPGDTGERRQHVQPAAARAAQHAGDLAVAQLGAVVAGAVDA